MTNIVNLHTDAAGDAQQRAGEPPVHAQAQGVSWPAGIRAIAGGHGQRSSGLLLSSFPSHAMHMQQPSAACNSRSCGRRLPAQLVEVINEDYADFVSLSTQLVNVDGAVARMQRPLGDLKVTPHGGCPPC
jgi:COG (conserved oligomeric Golgi) complex component, COG2